MQNIHDIKVSIVIPMYNSERFIIDTVTSILDQTYNNFELLIVDDGSSDSSAKIISENFNDKRLKYIYQKNQGAPAARNNGLYKSIGDYIMFFDADDVLGPTAIEDLTVKAIETNSDIAMGNYSKIDEYGTIGDRNFLSKKFKQIAEENSESIKKKLIAYLDPFPGNKLFKKEFLIDNGIEFQGLRLAQDLNFYMYCLAHGPSVTLVNNDTLYYRVHANSISHSYSDSILDIIKCFNIIEKEEFEFFVRNPEIFSTLKFVAFGHQIRKIPYFTDKKERKNIYYKLREGIKEIDIKEVELEYTVLNYKGLKLAIDHPVLFTSDVVSKRFRNKKP